MCDKKNKKKNQKLIFFNYKKVKLKYFCLTQAFD